MPIVSPENGPRKSNRRPLVLFLGGMACIPLMLVAMSLSHPITHRFGGHGITFGTHYENLGSYLHNETDSADLGLRPGVQITSGWLRDAAFTPVRRLSIHLGSDRWYLIGWW